MLIPRIRNGPRDHHFKVGETAELFCVAQGYPVPTYTWFKQDGSRLLQLTSNRHIQVVRSMLQIPKASKMDSSTYICVANNSAGEDRTHLQLTVSGMFYLNKILLLSLFSAVNIVAVIYRHTNQRGLLIDKLILK